jgi:hypothetical protein
MKLIIMMFKLFKIYVEKLHQLSGLISVSKSKQSEFYVHDLAVIKSANRVNISSYIANKSWSD